MGETELRSLRGSLPGSGRRPKVVDERRECAHEECHTVLSRYNLRDTCRAHTQIRFPRVRGLPTPE